MNLIFAWLASGLLLFSSMALSEGLLAPEALPGVTRITAEQTIEMLSGQQVVLIDARLKLMYEKGHIEGAHSISDTDLTLGALNIIAGNDKARPVLFYCDGPHCLRSGRAASKAVEFGFKRVYWLRGGWAEWTQKGFPVAK